MLVMKFGGTSVGTGERVLEVARIVLEHQEQHPVVVTSAMAGVTDTLLHLHAVAAAGNTEYHTMYTTLRQRHLDAAHAIDPDADWSRLHQRLAMLRADLATAYLNRDMSARMRDHIAAWGEQLAVLLVAGALDSSGGRSHAHDHPLIVTDDRFGEATPLPRQTRSLAQGVYAQAVERDAILVAPGFIGQTQFSTDRHRIITTLGRGGSDYAATLIAAALDAVACWIYTDVDGVFTADPRVVPEAHVLPLVSYAAAGRLACCGAKVLHPRAVSPVARRQIPLRVRNTFVPQHPGTLIAHAGDKTHGCAQAVAGRRNLCALSIVGPGLAEIPNLFGRMCQAVAEAGAEIVLAAHPIPGHDPHVLLDATRANAVRAQLERDLAGEIADGHVEAVVLQSDVALCTLVGDELHLATIDRAQRALALEEIMPLSQSVAADALSFVLLAEDLDRAVWRIHQEVVEPALRETLRRRPYHHLGGQWAAGGRSQSRLRVLQAQH
jgi:aspartate kinase